MHIVPYIARGGVLGDVFVGREDEYVRKSRDEHFDTNQKILQSVRYFVRIHLVRRVILLETKKIRQKNERSSSSKLGLALLALKGCQDRHFVKEKKIKKG